RGHARDRPREPGPGVLRVALGDRVPHVARGRAPVARPGPVAPRADAHRRGGRVPPDRPWRARDPRGLARAPLGGRPGRLRRRTGRDRAAPPEQRSRRAANGECAARAPRPPAPARRRKLPRAVLVRLDPRRADDDARSARRPPPRREPHLGRHGGACRLGHENRSGAPGTCADVSWQDGGSGTQPGRAGIRPPPECAGLADSWREGGSGTQPGRAGIRPPPECAGLADPATVTPPPTVHGDLAAPATSVIGTAIARDRRRVLADLLALAKPRVVLMILVTTAVGYYAGLTGAPDYARLLHVLVGTLLAAGGALALNQYWERDVDARMERTRARPLPDGRLAPLEALLFGSVLTALGLVYTGAFVGELALAITLATAALYLFAYTPLKRRTPLCTLVGAVPGALPPVTGWVAAREGFGVGAWVLGAAFVALGARQALVPSTVAARRVLFASLLYLPALLALLAFDKV